jgi:hypothetical protein
MNWKGYGKKVVIASFEALPQNLLGATEEYHKQSRCLVSEMITYSGISKI